MIVSDSYWTFSGRPILRSGTPLVLVAAFEEDDGSCTGEVYVRLLGGALPFAFDHALRLSPANVSGAPPGVVTIKKELFDLANAALGDALAALHDKFDIVAYLAHEWSLAEVDEAALAHVWLSRKADTLFRALSKGKTGSAALQARMVLISALPQVQTLPPVVQ